MRFTIFQDSRLGARKNNEDRIGYAYSRHALLMVVADGMGGHHYGEVASQIAVQTLTERFQREALPRLADPFAFLHQAMNDAHRAIADFSLEQRLNDSPRTTCVACVVQDSVAYWAHAGDSRLYLLREGKVQVQTRDHSRIRLLLDEGLITPEQAATHPDRNKIYSCLGGPQVPEIEFSRKTPLEQGDILVLSTDGFWGHMPAEMVAVALRNGNFLQTLPLLMNRAEQKGGSHADNLSVVAVRWEDNYALDLPGAISTLTLAPDEVSTHMEDFGRGERAKPDLSEDEIEAAIEEIRRAIAKYNPPPVK